MGRTIRRVPLDWNWPLSKTWDGFFMPDRLREKSCPDCHIDTPYPHSDGYSEYGRNLNDMWYGNAPFYPENNGSEAYRWNHPAVLKRAERNVEHSPYYYGTSEQALLHEASRLARHFNTAWCYHLNSDDVAALVEEERLREFTMNFDPEREPRWQQNDPLVVPTAKQVNEWAIGPGFGHDAINAWIVIGARAKREGQETACATCKGHGSQEVYPGQRAEAEAWESPEPPTGEGWQMWETVSEGSPVSPVFPTSEELAVWLTTEAGGEASGPSGVPMRLEAARAFVREGWAPSGFVDASGVHDGATFVGERAAAETKEIEA